MADTVKKSRIVSDTDDNLEEALMEEFNMRLKSCMSQDEILLENNTRKIDDDDNPIIENVYENISVIKNSNEPLDNNSSSSSSNKIDDNRVEKFGECGDFLRNERDNYYDVPKKISSNCNNFIHNNNSSSNSKIDDDNLGIYENLDDKNEQIIVDDDNKTDDNLIEIVDDDNTKKTDDVNLETTNQLMDQSYVDMTLKKNYHQFDDDNVDDNTERVYEEIEAINQQIPLIVNSATTPTKSINSDDDNQKELKSIKDRMLLSTDDNSCLLFTQTVTSPMLTPSEENIDFLKGFNETTSNNNTKTNITNNTVDDNNKKIINDEIIYENSEFLSTNKLNNNDNNKQEIIYENIDDIKQKIDDFNKVDDNLIDNKDEIDRITTNLAEKIEEIKEIVEDTTNKRIISNDDDDKPEDLKITTTNVDDNKIIIDEFLLNERKLIDSDSNKEIPAPKIDDNQSKLLSTSSSIIVEKINQISNKNDDNLINNKKNLENDTETTVPVHIVQNLKNQFMNNSNCDDNSLIINNNNDRNNELKTINIMKQINKFEYNNKNNLNGDDDNDDDDDNSLNGDDNNEDKRIDDISESYVETTTTTTFESQFSPQDNSNKAIKKKKSKKSRKEEKENISVNDSTTNNDELFYNVNVKNLCRSFGDLTKIGYDNNNRHYYNNCTDRMKEKLYSNVDNNKNVDKSNSLKINKIDSRRKSSFNKFDQLQKKNVLHVRSSDSSKAQEKFNGAQIDLSNCKSCDKPVFQMEQIKAEKSIWHKNCFRCIECSKQLTVDTYQSNEGVLFCKPHFKALFAPKAVEDDTSAPKPRKPELIIRENQPVELPPDVVRASDKPDLGLEELQSLNVKERFQVFENFKQQDEQQLEHDTINVKRSPSILSKLAKFQSKGMDIGVTDDSLNGIPIEESSSENENDEEENVEDGEDADLIRAKRVQKEKPFHFTGMNDVKNKWELGEQHLKDERREERKQEIQTIRNRLFMGKQVKMKEAYQQAVMESESCTNLNKKANNEPIELCDTRLIKERFEKGELINNDINKVRDNEENEVYESEMSKKSRSLFKELDANASKPPQFVSQMSTQPNVKLDVKKAREAYLSKTSNEDVIKSSSEQSDDVQIRTADIQERFKFFETYKEPETVKKSFRITPPREGQIKGPTPDREIYHDPDVVRSEEYIEDSVVAKQSHTATKMLNKFRQMEENLNKESVPAGPKPLKCFTPPPEPLRQEESSNEDDEDDEDEEEDEEDEEQQQQRILDGDLIEAQKAARAKQLRAKFERWEANEIKREQQNSINLTEEISGEEQSQIESTKALRARFESMRETNTDVNKTPRVKVNRFVDISNIMIESCESCNLRVYPLEKISVHGHIYHKSCFKCKECSCVLRMESYSYNQGLLYCTPHFKRLFISKGNYDTAFGLGPHKEKWNYSGGNNSNNSTATTTTNNNINNATLA